MSDNPKEYIGDGAYCEFDGYSLIVTTSDGIRTTNEVVLEPIVFLELLRFAQRCGYKITDALRDLSNRRTAE